MSNLDVQAALQSSLLQRVPNIAADLVRDGMGPREAIKAAIIKARDAEEMIAVEWLRASELWRNNSPYALNSREQGMVEYLDGLCRRIWTKARAAQPAQEA